MSNELHTLDDIIRKARDITLAKGFHKPTVIAVGDKGSHLMVPTELGPGHQKRAQDMYNMGFEMARKPLGLMKSVYFISEGWMAQPPDGADRGWTPTGDQRRIEVLMIHSYDLATKFNELVVYKMIRDGAGKVVELDLWKDSREDPGMRPEYSLLDHFMRGYNRARRGRLN
jgi:hypothetical protein